MLSKFNKLQVYGEILLQAVVNHLLPSYCSVNAACGPNPASNIYRKGRVGSGEGKESIWITFVHLPFMTWTVKDTLDAFC